MIVPHAIRIAMIVLGGMALLASGFGCTCVHKEVAVQEGVRPGEGQQQLQSTPGPVVEGSSDELRAWREGATAFESGAYEKAQSIFEALSQNGSTNDLRLRALYALACTRLVEAKNPGEFKGAMALMERWCQSANGELHDEDWRLMVVALRRMTDTLANSQPTAPHSAGASAGRPAARETVRVVKDKECETLVRSKDRDIQGLRQQIGVLRHQLEALEKIHREIQEKKEQVSPP